MVELGLRLHRAPVILRLLVPTVGFATNLSRPWTHYDKLEKQFLWSGVSPAVSKKHFLCQCEVERVECGKAVGVGDVCCFFFVFCFFPKSAFLSSCLD